MKVLHVVASYLPARRYGGTIASVHGLCRALAALGHDVHVYTTSVNGPEDSDVPHDVPVDVDGVKVWYFRSTQPRRLFRAPDLGAALRARVSGFDIVHTHAVYLWPLWAAAAAARRATVPYVVSPRGMLERDLIARKNPLLKAIWIAAIERHNLEGASAIHVTTRREAEEAQALGLRLPGIHEIPNGVTFEDASGPVSDAVRRIVDGPPYVLFLGRLNWKKGLDRLLPAIARVADTRLVLAGHDEDGYRAVVEDLSARLGVADRVIFAGEVHGANKAALLDGAAMLALTSYSENFGNVVVEACAAGCPVIVTKEVGLADTVEREDVGLSVTGGPEAIAAAVATLMGDPSRRRAMGSRGRTLAAREFSWSTVAHRMESLYASLVGRH